MDSPVTHPIPTSEELKAELLSMPEPPEQPEPITEPGFEELVTVALRHVRGRRGGDLVSVILVGSSVRRAITTHSDIDLIALVKGQADGHEIVRVADRLADIRYRGHQELEEDLPYSPRLPSLLRKARILFDHDDIGAKLIERANQRFRQGPPPIFFDDVVSAFFRLRGFWLTTPVDVPKFIASRDATLGDLAGRFLTAATLPERLNLGRDLADLLFKDVPNPARID
jgi:predicted nucleotidyltransferase